MELKSYAGILETSPWEVDCFSWLICPRGKNIRVHRTSMEGKIQLQCPRMVELIQQHPQLAMVPFTKSHLMLVPGATRCLFIAGAASAHPMLQTMPRHGDIGTGSCINSTQRTGLKHNCKAIWVLRPSNEILKNVTGMTFEPVFYYDLVFYLSDDVKAGQQALYFYNCDSDPAPAEEPAPAKAKAPAAAKATATAKPNSVGGGVCQIRSYNKVGTHAAATAPACRRQIMDKQSLRTFVTILVTWMEIVGG
jgi:hypothetical protein